MSTAATKSYRALLVGFGKIAQGNAFDKQMATSMKYATHAQVLAAHPQFQWCAVVDTNEDARESARNNWNIHDVAASVEALTCKDEIEVAVLSTPPEHRLGIIEQLPALKAVLVEKPIGVTLADAEAFLQTCRDRNIVVQVNLLRRADKLTRALAAGELADLVGDVQCAFGLYGRGLINNGIHIVDLARMLFGEVEKVQATTAGETFEEGPIDGDLNFPFNLVFSSGMVVHMQPLKFGHFRENGLDIWGQRGRLSYLNSGFSVLHYPVHASQHVEHEREIDLTAPAPLASTLGDAFYAMYENIIRAIDADEALVSPPESALRSSKVVHAAFQSLRNHGPSVVVDYGA